MSNKETKPVEGRVRVSVGKCSRFIADMSFHHSGPVTPEGQMVNAEELRDAIRGAELLKPKRRFKLP